MQFWCFVLCIHVKPFSQPWLSWGRSTDQISRTVKVLHILQHQTFRQNAHPTLSDIQTLYSLHFICPVVRSRHEHVCLLSFLWVSDICPDMLDPLVSLMRGFFPHVIGVSHCVVIFILDCGDCLLRIELWKPPRTVWVFLQLKTPRVSVVLS